MIICVNIQTTAWVTDTTTKSFLAIKTWVNSVQWKPWYCGISNVIFSPLQSIVVAIAITFYQTSFLCSMHSWFQQFAFKKYLTNQNLRQQSNHKAGMLVAATIQSKLNTVNQYPIKRQEHSWLLRFTDVSRPWHVRYSRFATQPKDVSLPRHFRYPASSLPNY